MTGKPKPVFGPYRALVVRVVDGDGVIMTIMVGFRFTAELPIRLLGLNAPEKNTPEGKAAMAWTTDWCARHPDVLVTTEKDPEKYGRWLGRIVGADDGESLNDALIAAGHALAWDGKGPRPT